MYSVSEEKKQVTPRIKPPSCIGGSYLSRGWYPNRRNHKNTSELYLAIQNKQIIYALQLIEDEAGVETETKQGSFPLYIASQYGHTKVVDALIKANANVNKVNNYDGSPYSALLIAVESGWLGVVKLLVEAGASTKITDIHSEVFDTIEIAKAKGQDNIVAELIITGQKRNLQRARYDQMVQLPAQTQSVEDKSDSLEVVPSPVYQRIPLSQVQKDEYMQKIRKLVKECARTINAQEDYIPILIDVVKNGFPEAVSLLCENVASLSSLEDAPLDTALQHRRIDCARVLVEHGANIERFVNEEDVSVFREHKQYSGLTIEEKERFIEILEERLAGLKEAELSRERKEEKERLEARKRTEEGKRKKEEEARKFADGEELKQDVERKRVREHKRRRRWEILGRRLSSFKHKGNDVGWKIIEDTNGIAKKVIVFIKPNPTNYKEQYPEREKGGRKSRPFSTKRIISLTQSQRGCG